MHAAAEAQLSRHVPAGTSTSTSMGRLGSRQADTCSPGIGVDPSLNVGESIRPSQVFPPSSTGGSPSSEARVRPAQIGTASQLLAGGIAGAVSKTCTAPLARLTILLQLQGMHKDLGVPSVGKAHGVLHEAGRILKEEGLRAFWKGNAVTIVHRLPYSAINFFSYEKYKSVLMDLTGIDPGQESLGVGMGTKLLAGGGAGLTAASMTYPLDLVRTRLAAQRQSRYYRGILGTLSTISRDEGIRGLYKGMGATLLGVGPAIAINFTVYETLKANWLVNHPATPMPLVSLGCGSLAGICSSTATFPLDLVRRRMQLEGAGGRASVYKQGIAGTLMHIAQSEGYFALYRGIIPEYMKVVPGVSIAFMTYEFMKAGLREQTAPFVQR